MSKTPETDNLARGNHVVPTGFAARLERERDNARAEVIRLERKLEELRLAYNELIAEPPLKIKLRKRE